MATKTIDITKEHCPMTFVKTKIALHALKSGDTLEVLLLKGEPLDNVPRSAEGEGHQVLAVESAVEPADVYRVIIKKA